MLVPLASTCSAATSRRLWLVAVGLLTLGALSTGSRTGTTMLIALLVASLAIKPRESRPARAAAVPMLIVIQVVMPGTLGHDAARCSARAT